MKAPRQGRLAEAFQHPSREDGDPRIGVAQDIVDLSGGQRGRDQQIMDANPLRPPNELVQTRVIFRHDRDDVAGANALIAQPVRHLIGACLKLGIGDGLTRTGHDIGRFVRGLRGKSAGVHG